MQPFGSQEFSLASAEVQCIPVTLHSQASSCKKKPSCCEKKSSCCKMRPDMWRPDEHIFTQRTREGPLGKPETFSLPFPVQLDLQTDGLAVSADLA